MKYTIVVGNPIDGFDLVGVYNRCERALDAAEDHFSGESWWIAEIAEIGDF